MKNVDKLLFTIMVLLVVIICVLTIILMNKQPEDLAQIDNKIKVSIVEVTDRNNYYMVKNCANKFYQYYALLYENIDEDNAVKLYNLLDDKYIEYKGITTENIEEVLPEMKYSVVNIYNMYVGEPNENTFIYIVDGILREEVSKELSNFQIMLQIDKQNKTFSVLLQDYIQEKHKEDIDTQKMLIIESLNNITKNRYNTYVYEEISDQTYLIDLLNNYKEEALYNLELAYEHLDTEYRSAKFETLENFKAYVEENEKRISNAKLDKYKTTQEDGYKQHICIDKDGYYYIFRETGLIEYTLILDTYTIDLPEFLQKYNSANTIKRAGYNIQRCLDALNYKDYEYVYNKLDFEFKAINYPTLENFEKTIKNKLFNFNEVKSVSNNYYEGSTHIYKLVITDKNNTNKEVKMTYIVQLKEGTDFVMSFSFED